MGEQLRPILFFNSVPEALAPLSAGTYNYKVCTTCISDEGTIIQQSIETPHPIWTNGFGKAVVQLESVELGGMYGLNS